MIAYLRGKCWYHFHIHGIIRQWFVPFRNEHFLELFTKCDIKDLLTTVPYVIYRHCGLYRISQTIIVITCQSWSYSCRINLDQQIIGIQNARLPQSFVQDNLCRFWNCNLTNVLDVQVNVFRNRNVIQRIVCSKIGKNISKTH